MADKSKAVRLGAALALVLLALVAIALACQERNAAQRPDPLDAWHQALSQAHVDPARVVVISDSMGELSLGYEDVWKAFHESVTLSPRGTWFPPRRFNGSFGWEQLPGEPAEIGVEGRGQLLRQGDGPAGRSTPVLAPTTMDLYYTARPDGAPLEVRVDGVTLATVDTARDERGVPVTEEVKAQRWRSPFLGREVAWQVEVSGPGVAAIETAHFPPSAGIEVHGTGLSGAATSQFLERGYAIAHIEAMVARGEAPDLVVWAADTADSPDIGAQLATLEQAFEETRRVAPSASVANYIPTGHNGRSDWSTWAARYRTVAQNNDVAVIDGFEALGDVSRGAPNAHLAVDGVHLTKVGQSKMDEAWIAALAPGPLVPVSPSE